MAAMSRTFRHNSDGRRHKITIHPPHIRHSLSALLTPLPHSNARKTSPTASPCLTHRLVVSSRPTFHLRLLNLNTQHQDTIELLSERSWYLIGSGTIPLVSQVCQKVA